jgi:hypothetical protein
MRFENTIDLGSTIGGRLEVVFKGTLSGVKGVDLYFPLGGRREGSATVETRVNADFELNLGGLRYQEVRVVPDSKRQEDGDKPETATFEGVIPDHDTVIALTNAVSEQGFYVKRVIENPPRTGGRANVVNRYWDIAGRRYLGVYPIDFHLILTGEEVYMGEIRAQAGTTRTTLTVQGTYASPDMEGRIENVWEQLHHLVVDTLRQLPRVRPAPEPPGGEEQPVQPAWSAAHGDEPARRAAVLWKRLDQLLEALIDGRVSEGTYLKLKTSIEQELASLQSAI